MKRPFGDTGVEVPIIGQGTWLMGKALAREAAALERGLDLGLMHIDTAELYGAAEDVVGRVLRARGRDGVFLVSKVLPEHATWRGTLEACDRSLSKLGTDHLDVYLLHWRGSHPLDETMRALEELVRQGKTRFLGVSNFDVSDLEEAARALGRERIVCDQVYYDLEHRGVERDLIPRCQALGIAVVGYSPFGHGRLPGPRSARGKVLAEVAREAGATPAQVVLAFLTRLEGTFTIPKASSLDHVEDNAGALDLRLTPEQVARIDAAFPAPDEDVPLAVL